MFIIEDEKRNKACKDLEKKFAERFLGLHLIWSEADRNSREMQKFRLVDSISGQKLRLVFISNESFEDGTVDSFLRKFEEGIDVLAKRGNESMKYYNGRLILEHLQR